MAAAWENGLDGAAIPNMTPSEARGMFKARSVNLTAGAADMDRLAWLIGNYCATAFNCPKRYPRKPRNADRIMGQYKKTRMMTDDEMRENAKNFARRWNEQCRQS